MGRVVALLVVVLLAAAAPARAQAPTEVRVMTFNIWLGGDVVDSGSVIRAIQGAHADIVGLQEAEGNTRKIAQALGWPYWSDRLHVVSRYPLIDPPVARGEYVLAQISPGRVFALANVHLTSDPYGPYLVRDGRSLARVLANERATRLPEIRHTLRALRPALRRGIPTFMTGDFNTPSHLDWTAAADAVRDDIHYPVAWPVTEAVQRAGFRDTYRVVHPDPVATPGITWTFGYPFPRIAKDEVVDRIDLVQASAGRARCSTAGSSARRARATSPSRSTRTRPTTARSSPPSASRPRRRGRSRPCSIGASSAATRSASATRRRAARASTRCGSCATAAARAAR